MIIPGMVSNTGNRWAVAGGTFALWALVAATAVFWGLKLSNGSGGLPAAAPVRGPVQADPLAVARLLGSNPMAPAAAPVASLSSRFNLVGVVANTTHQGAALIAVDGKPPKPFRVGSAVDEGLVLQSVSTRQAALGPTIDGPASVTLELPLPVRR